MSWLVLFWVVAVLTTLIAVAVLALPLLLRRARSITDTAAYDLEVYRDQLAELKREQQHELLSAEQYAAAEAEISRRMLAADAELQRHADALPRGLGRTGAAALAIVLIVAVPLGASLLYLKVGSPSQPDMPLAQRSGSPDEGGSGSELQAQIAQLETQVATSPDDAEAWLHLGLARKSANQFAGAAAALRRAMELLPATPELSSEFGETVVMAADGMVTPEARKAFQTALDADPSDVRALFYMALGDYQAGKTKEALDAWVGLVREAPADAPWLNVVRAQITRAAGDLGLDVATVMPEPRPAERPAGPATLTPEQRAAMAEMSPEERETFIRQMVDSLSARLDENPMDLDGWLRLIRARTVLGEGDAAQASLDRALKVFAAAPEARRQLTALGGELGLRLPDAGAASNSDGGAGATNLPDVSTMVGKLEARLKADPTDIDGWLLLSRSYAVMQQPDKARDALARAAALNPDNPDMLTMQARQIREASGGKETPQSLAIMRHVLELQPDNIEALWFVGQAEAEAGNFAHARELLERAYAQIPADNADRAFVRKTIDALPGG